MDILDAIDGLSKEEPRLLLINFILYALGESSIASKFHDNKNIAGCIEYFIEFDDIGMIKIF
jgi:hypothetical protein